MEYGNSNSFGIRQLAFGNHDVPDIDFFNFFRYFLGTVVTIYATVLTLQNGWEWLAWLSGREKYISMLRRYVIVHGLRLRFRAFWGDVIICTLLCVVFLILWRAHHVIEGTSKVWNEVSDVTRSAKHL